MHYNLKFTKTPKPNKFITNTNNKTKINLTLHNKITNIPTSHIKITINKKPPYQIHIHNIIHEQTFHKPKLTLITNISTTPNSNNLHITNTVTNNNNNPQKIQLIYHTNYNQPLLKTNTNIIIPTN